MRTCMLKNEDISHKERVNRISSHLYICFKGSLHEKEMEVILSIRGVWTLWFGRIELKSYSFF